MPPSHPPPTAAPPAPAEQPPLMSTFRSFFTTPASTTSPSALLSDLAPQLLQSRILSSPHFDPNRQSTVAQLGTSSSTIRGRLGLLGGIGTSIRRGGSGKGTWREMEILDRVDELTALEVPLAGFSFSPASGSTPGYGSLVARLEYPVLSVQEQESGAQVPLIQGFNATAPSSLHSRLRRRQKRAGLGELHLGVDGKLGLKERVDSARGLLASGEEDEMTRSGVGRKARKARRSGRKKKGANVGEFGEVLDDADKEDGWEEVDLSKEELEDDRKAVEQDLGNVTVKRALLNSQISEVDGKIQALETIRDGLRRNLLGLREEELELTDEYHGLEERIASKEEAQATGARNATISSRRRKGPAFLPGEHDDLPPGVAFMTLAGHSAPITSMDFSEPYGTAVTASLDETVRMWDLQTGEEVGYLRGHSGVVKALQVESSICVTGSTDGQIKIWNLDLAYADALAPPPTSSIPLPNASTTDDVFGFGQASGQMTEEPEGMMREDPNNVAQGGPCVKTLDGHTKAVTSLYFDESCLVTGSSDRTLRQWDLQTGQCVLTMDILWAISNPLASQSLSSEETSPYPDPYSSPSSPARGSTANGGYSTPDSSPRRPLKRQSSSFLTSSGTFATSPTTTTYADGSWEMYEDFVGAVQFWGYGLASGTGDGCVRLWDMRTGQAARTLVGHTGPVTCVQFDENCVVSGSLDKSIRMWDIRSGGIYHTIRYDHPVTALQFDSRKIVAAAGENGVRVYNRTTLQNSTLSINGHTSAVERLRFMDRYLATGGRDCTVKIWALP